MQAGCSSHPRARFFFFADERLRAASARGGLADVNKELLRSEKAIMFPRCAPPRLPVLCRTASSCRRGCWRRGASCSRRNPKAGGRSARAISTSSAALEGHAEVGCPLPCSVGRVNLQGITFMTRSLNHVLAFFVVSTSLVSIDWLSRSASPPCLRRQTLCMTTYISRAACGSKSNVLGNLSLRC